MVRIFYWKQRKEHPGFLINLSGCEEQKEEGRGET